MFNHSVKRRRLFVIDLPLYASVDSVELEIDSEAFVEPATDLFPKGRIVVYGTSITQGGCASRPGMAYPAIIAREIGYEFINYGFSGSGKGEKAIAELVASTQDVSMFILDYEGNADENQILENTLEPFVATIREKYPAVPILIISKIRMAKETHFLEKLNHALKMSVFRPVLSKNKGNRAMPTFIFLMARTCSFRFSTKQRSTESIRPIWASTLWPTGL